MKATGMLRKVDELGRIVIPKELRRQYNVEDNKDFFEIFVEDDAIILKKYQPSCIFCGELKEISNYKGHNICSSCIQAISNLK
ncbi:MAG TPA: AbrB/MazE/SpoVT family DNA-binding domain-containing protein [Clostridiales bacterium]|nr:AbrB/MazE/SpoVT family DNA-binding domain-containing protein [Clostridiales bacterium]